jgi:hypothetical protein
MTKEQIEVIIKKIKEVQENFIKKADALIEKLS